MAITGPNTGGMGTVSPAWTTDDLLERITHEILEPTVRGLAADGIDYRGVLYAGVMVDAGGAPWLLEYNCRFGDPETQPIMARMVGDLGAVLAGAARGELPHGALAWDARVAVCVVVAAAGYPGDAAHRRSDRRPRRTSTTTSIVFHAGTARKDGAARHRRRPRARRDRARRQRRSRRASGRTPPSIAIELAGKQVRRDIGARALR